VNDEGRRRDRGEPCPAVSSHPNCCELTSEPTRRTTSSNLLAEESAAGLFVEWMSSARDAPREGNAVIEEARLVLDGIRGRTHHHRHRVGFDRRHVRIARG
jgi:hypothetical protein